jgi:ribosomal protein S21
MALEVRKQERETSQNLIRRFTKRVQKSGVLLQARKIMFKRRQKSDEAKKRAALRREELKKHYQKLRKLGKIE